MVVMLIKPKDNIQYDITEACPSYSKGGGISGQATEIKIHADHMIRTREKLNKLLSDRTGQSIETIERDTERDHYMTAEEALKYGLIDGIMDKRM